MSRNTDPMGRMLLNRIDALNKKLKKSLAGGVSTQDETLRLMKEGQPLRQAMLQRIYNTKLRTTYYKIKQNVQQLLDKKPRGQYGQAEINASLKKADEILKS